MPEATSFPEIDVFEKDGRLVTKIDLPGMKEGRRQNGGRRRAARALRRAADRGGRGEGAFLSLRARVRQLLSRSSVARRREARGLKATFSDGVLEVSIPLPANPEAKVRKVEIQEARKLAQGSR